MRSTKWLGLSLLYGALSAAFCWRLFVQPSGLGMMDWDKELFYFGAVLKNAIEYGQLPLWNPWHCGGDVLWQNPQVELLTPVYPLALVMPLALAVKVTIVLHYFVAFIGMHLLLEDVIGLTFLPLIVYLAALFTMSGAPAMHVAVGHGVFMPMFYLPLLLFFILRAFRTSAVKDAILAGAVLMLMIVNGGQHIVAMAVIAIAMLTVTAAAARRSWTPLVLAGILAVSGAAYSAPKLVPVIDFVASGRFADERGAFIHPDHMSVSMLARAYLSPPDDDRSDPAQIHGWYEYGNYLGTLAPFLIVASFLWTIWNWRERDGWLGCSLALTTLLLVVWSAGEFARFAPASLALHLPFFSRFRVPSRYAITVGLFAAATVGWTVKAMVGEIGRHTRFFVAVVCALATVQLLQNGGNFDGAFSQAPLDRGFAWMQGPREMRVDRSTSAFAPNSPMLRSLMSGVSVGACYEPLQLVHTEEAGLPLVSSTGDAVVRDVSFTPNRVEFAVVGGRETSRIVLNENYAPGWSSTAGPVELDAAGRMSVALKPGQTGKFAFTYWPPGLWLGLLIFLAALALTPVVWNWKIGDRA